MQIKKAFTIVEILVTLIIIGVLVAASIPNFLSTYTHTEALHAAQDLQSIQSAQLVYLQRTGAYYFTPANLIGSDQ